MFCVLNCCTACTPSFQPLFLILRCCQASLQPQLISFLLYLGQAMLCKLSPLLDAMPNPEPLQTNALRVAACKLPPAQPCVSSPPPLSLILSPPPSSPPHVAPATVCPPTPLAACSEHGGIYRQAAHFNASSLLFVYRVPSRSPSNAAHPMQPVQRSPSNAACPTPVPIRAVRQLLIPTLGAPLSTPAAWLNHQVSNRAKHTTQANHRHKRMAVSMPGMAGMVG